MRQIPDSRICLIQTPHPNQAGRRMKCCPLRNPVGIFPLHRQMVGGAGILQTEVNAVTEITSLHAPQKTGTQMFDMSIL